ncbi:hypothetical protein POUND7_008001 [Theobroma cacao]
MVPSELEQTEGSKLSSQSATPNEDGKTIMDHKGGGWTTFPFIIGSMTGLSLVAGGWGANLIVFLINEFHVKSITATQINNVILGCNSLFPIAGAIVADTFFDSYRVIITFAFVSLLVRNLVRWWDFLVVYGWLGMILLTLTTTINSLKPSLCAIGASKCPTPSKLQFAVLYIALALASLGVGGTRFTIATMGADQFDDAKDQGIFFNWYFLALYIANCVSLTALIYIQDNVSWGLAFGICTVLNAIALVLFLSGKRFYRRIKPKGSPFRSILCVIFAAIQKRNVPGTFDSQDYYYGSVEMTNIFNNGPSKSLRFLNCAALKIESEDSQSSRSNAGSWKLCTVEEVEDLKTLLKIMPLWSSSILLSTTIGVLNSLAIVQVLTMDRHLGPHFKIPAGSFIMFNLLATALSIFIIDRFLHPAWQKFIPIWPLTPLRRIGIGHIINILAMMGSALIEMRRLHVVRTDQQLTNQSDYVVPISGLWLVVPLTILGIGEAFHFPGQIALYYQEFPKSLKVDEYLKIVEKHASGLLPEMRKDGSMTGLSLVAGGWGANLIVFLINEFHVKSITATQINNVILGCNYLLPIAGAIVADTFFDSYTVIITFAFVSLLGMILLTLTTTIHSLKPSPCAMGASTCPTPSKLQFAVLYIALALASLGVGGTRFTIATMGADQFDDAKDQGIFFNWYFLALYIANCVSLTALIYIQDNVSWGLAFGICTVLNAIALVLFLSGKRFYRRIKPKRSPFLSILCVIFAAIRKRNVPGTFGSQDYYYGSVETTNIFNNGPSKSLRFLNCAALKFESEDSQSSRSNARSWKLCTVEEVEDLKTLLKIMPLWSSSILLSTTIGVLNSLAIVQVLTMDRHLGPHFKIPAGSFIMFNLLATALSIFIIDRFLHPAWQKFIPIWPLTPLRRIGIGHIINILAMMGSALIEMRRLHVVRTHQRVTNQSDYVVPISGLWLVVPLTILGIGEAFHFPGQIALYYQEFPKSLKVDEYLKIVEKHASGLLPEMRKDEYEVREKPSLNIWMQGGLDYIMLQLMNIDRIRTIGSVLGQSIALDYYISAPGNFLQPILKVIGT